MECKVVNSSDSTSGIPGSNRDIVECKDVGAISGASAEDM